MRIEIQDAIIAGLKDLAFSLGLQDHTTLGLALVERERNPGGAVSGLMQVVGTLLGGVMLGDPGLGQKLANLYGKVGTERELMHELNLMSDEQGSAFCAKLVQFRQIAPPMLARGMKGYAATLDSEPGRPHALSVAQKKAACGKHPVNTIGRAEGCGA